MPQLAEKAREKGIEQLNILEKKYSYFDQTLPPRRMTENQRKKLMKKISRIANSLDNAIPYSPIPIGIDTILVIVSNVDYGDLFSLIQLRRALFLSLVAY